MVRLCKTKDIFISYMRHKNHLFRDLLAVLKEAVSENNSSLVKGSSTRIAVWSEFARHP